MMDQPASGKAQAKTASLLLLLVIVATAVGLRFTRLDLAEFKSDEAGIEREALALVYEGKFPAVGPSSSQGPAHPPLQVYLLALPFAITQDPRLAVVVVALIHSGAVVVVYFIGERFFDRRVGLIAAFLLAVNPWAVYYARKIWTQNWPLATTLFVLFMLLFAVERRSWALVGAALALVALIGTHLGGIAFFVVFVLIVILFRSYVERRHLLAGGCVLLIVALPYLYHDATHNWVNLSGFFDLGGGPAQVDFDAVRFATWLSSGFHYQDLTGARHSQFLDSLLDLRWIDVLVMALFGIGVIYLIVRVARDVVRRPENWQRSAGRDLVLLLWLLVPVILQIRHSQPVYPHYFILLYPVQFLIIAILLSDALKWLSARLDQQVGRWLVAGLVGLLVVIGVWQVYLGQRFVCFVAQYDTPGGYGPVAGPLVATAASASEAAGDGAEILVVAQGDNPVWDNVPSAFDVLLPRHLFHRFVDGRTGLVYPQNATVYVIAPDVPEVSTALKRQPGTALVEGIGAPGGKTFWVFRRENESRDDVLEGMTELPLPHRLANGVEFLAYSVEGEWEPGGTLNLYLAWWLDAPTPEGIDYHTFAHLVNASGERYGQHDLSSFSTSSWQTGDLVLTRFQIVVDAEASPGEYWVHLGMYSYPDIVNVPIVDAAGNPTADAVIVGPIVLH